MSAVQFSASLVCWMFVLYNYANYLQTQKYEIFVFRKMNWHLLLILVVCMTILSIFYLNSTAVNFSQVKDHLTLLFISSDLLTTLKFLFLWSSPVRECIFYFAVQNTKTWFTSYLNEYDSQTRYIDIFVISID